MKPNEKHFDLLLTKGKSLKQNKETSIKNKADKEDC
jgi:hypothetical protein